MENLKDIQNQMELDELIQEAGEKINDANETKTSWAHEHREELAKLAESAGKARAVWKESGKEPKAR